MKTYYVLQRKKYPHDDRHWETLEGQRYATLGEARAALAERTIPHLPQIYRIAEAYTVVRYRAVK